MDIIDGMQAIRAAMMMIDSTIKFARRVLGSAPTTVCQSGMLDVFRRGIEISAYSTEV